MRKMMIAAAVALSMAASAAYAAIQDFTIHNSTGQAILTLNVSPSDSNDWGPDILGVDILAAGESADISFDMDEEQCEWDIRVTYEDGGVGDWRGIDLCSTTDINLT